MAENGFPEGPALPQEAVKPPEVERSSVRNALTETAKALFPVAEWARSGLQKDVDKNKTLWKTTIALGRVVDVARYAAVAGNIVNAVNADSTETIIKSSVLAAGFLSPNLVHLASKSRLIRETGKKIGRGVVNAVLGKASAFKDTSPKK